MKAAILNDTYGPHAGCQLVSEAYRDQLQRVGIELLGTVHKTQRRIDQYPKFVKRADLVIVNGEGSIHHGNRLELVEVASRFPAMLMNCVFEANPPLPALRMFQFVTARESLSAAELRAQGVAAEVVPDVMITAGTLLRYRRNKPAKDVGVTDNVVDASAGFTVLVGEGNVTVYLEALSSFRRLCVGRFHAALMASVLGIPFSAWASNTHKTRGLMMDMGIPHLYAETLDEALPLVPDAPEESVARYIDEGRRKVDSLFERLHTYA